MPDGCNFLLGLCSMYGTRCFKVTRLVGLKPTQFIPCAFNVTETLELQKVKNPRQIRSKAFIKVLAYVFHNSCMRMRVEVA